MTHMFWWSRPWTQSVVLALVHCGRNARIWLFRIIFEVSPVSDRIGLRFTYLREKSLFGIGDTSRGGTVDQLSRLLWRREMFAKNMRFDQLTLTQISSL
jgi:hypothetical protein